jgi:pimeloyl-ACP methyl ester carboxylesterase
MPSIHTKDIRTFYAAVGAGHPLVLLHGGLADHRMWFPQIAGLAHDYHLVLYDMRGHGRTGPSSLLRYSTRVFADDLRALLTNLRIERPIICGLSLGGMVAQAYATAYPDDLAALILCGTAVSTTFTLADKAQIYPFGWSIAPSVRLMGAAVCGLCVVGRQTYSRRSMAWTQPPCA